MEEVAAVRVGSSKAVFRANLVSRLREHGGVAVRWPKRKGWGLTPPASAPVRPSRASARLLRARLLSRGLMRRLP